MSDTKTQWAPSLPEFKVNSTKSGYEIRTEILDMAKSLVEAEFSYKLHGWELSSTRDKNTGELVSKVSMPEFPGLAQVLDTAEKMYAFVNQQSKR